MKAALKFDQPLFPLRNRQENSYKKPTASRWYQICPELFTIRSRRVTVSIYSPHLLRFYCRFPTA